MSNTSVNSTTSVDSSNQIKYILMQICYIPSIICSIFTLFHLLWNRNLRSTFHNHISLALLTISITDSFFNHSLTLNYLRISKVVPFTNSLCLFWNFINSVFTIASFLTMAWGSIERHLLIFHSSLFFTKRGRILFHYIPLFTTSLIYPVLSNLVIILFYPCRNQFNMSSLFCGYTCALKIQSVALYARIAHNFVPTFIVIISTLTLIARVIMQKRQVQRNQFNWRRCRRMIIQLLALASLFLALTFPVTLISIVQNCCLATFAAAQSSNLNFLVRFLTIFMPFICLSLLPEIWSKLLPWKNQVQPVTTIRAGTIFNQQVKN